MKKAKVVPPVCIFVPDGSKELGLIIGLLWTACTLYLTFCMRANGFGFDLHWVAFVAAALIQAVFGFMPIMYAVVLMRWSARKGWSYFLSLVILPILFAEIYFLPEDWAFRAEVRETNAVELSRARATPFSFATMTYEEEDGYWTYGWD